MNENVTNKTPKRRRWIARLLVSALCILLASSLLFVSVVADVGVLSLQGSSTAIISKATSQICFLDYDFFVCVIENNIYLYRDDVLLKEYYIPTFVSGYLSPSGTDYGIYSLCFDRERSLLYAIAQYEHDLRIITFVISDFDIVSSSFASYYLSYSTEYYWPPCCAFDGRVYFVGFGNGFFVFFNGDVETLGSVSNTSWLNVALLYRSGSCYFDGYCFFPDGQVIVDTSGNYVSKCPSYPIFVFDGKACYAKNNFIYSVDPLTGNSSAIYQFFDFSFSGYFLGFSNSSVLTLMQKGDTASLTLGVFSWNNSSPESSDETTEEPPPESSEESSEESSGSVVDVYKTSPGSDPVFVQSVDLGEATSATVFLGSYFITDETWGDISQYCYIQLYGDSGPLDRITFDFYATGFSYDNSIWDYPKIIGTNFDIDVSDLESLYISTLSPFGTVTVQNESAVLRQFNFQSASAYVEIENVSAEEAVWYVYGSDTDSSPATFTTSGMQKYIIRRQTGNASIPVLLDYGSNGIVSASLTYNGSPFPVGGIIITDDQYLIPPIDTGSWDNVLSQAQSEQEFNKSSID